MSDTALAVPLAASSSPSPARQRLTGFLLVLLATLGWSLSGIFMRLLEEPDPWRTNGYRAASMALAMTLWLLWRYRGGLLAKVRSLPPAALLLSTGFFSVGSTLYLVALSLAPVADVACLTATSPLFAALLARLLIGERTQPLVLAATLVALGGVTLMVVDQLGVEGGWIGQAVAIFVAFSFAGQTVALRRYRLVEIMPAFVLGGLITATITLGFMVGSLPSRHDLLLIALMGVVQLALPIALYARGARYLPAVQLALFALLDVVLNPFWAWLGVGEAPSWHTVYGGLLIVGAVVVVALRR